MHIVIDYKPSWLSTASPPPTIPLKHGLSEDVLGLTMALPRIGMNQPTWAILQRMVRLEDLGGTLTNDDAWSHGVAGRHPGHDRSIRNPKVRMVVAGGLNKQVAGELGISEITVKAHRGKLMRKMKADSLPHLVNMAARLTST